MQEETVLVVGGAGYIGSHMVRTLIDSGRRVLALDNLSTGHRSAVPAEHLIVGDLGDSHFVQRVFAEHHITTVMHFAAHIEVGESVINPSKYYHNNLANTLTLLEAMIAADVKSFVFSSTAAVFGTPLYTPIDENHQTKPINPYGNTKLMVEQILRDYDAAYGLKSVCLRYFNAAGAHPDGTLGESHEPESHLIPLVLQAASGRRESISVFGNDYDTSDGSCVRDYIHVLDLCDAHALALQHLESSGNSAAFNLGNGNGYSVLELIEVARRVTGRKINVMFASRRPGDPETLVADATEAKKVLNWSPKRTDLQQIIEDAWQWEQVLCRTTS